MDAAYNGRFHIKFFDFFDIIYRGNLINDKFGMGPMGFEPCW
jgi:hypothetical protein